LTNSNENHWKSRPSNLYIKPIVDDYSLKLFNLKNDPGERENLSDTNPQKIKELEEAYQTWSASNIGQY
jgi:hypothetical protein